MICRNDPFFVADPRQRAEAMVVFKICREIWRDREGGKKGNVGELADFVMLLRPGRSIPGIEGIE